MKTFEVSPHTSSIEANRTWNKIVGEARNGFFIAKRDYMDYHQHRFNDCSVIVSKGGSGVAAIPCNREGKTVHSHAGLTFGGLLMPAGLRLGEVREIFRAIVKWFVATGAEVLIYKSVPHPYHRSPAHEDQAALLELGGHCIETKLSCVITKGSSPPFSASRQRELVVAGRTGVVVNQEDGIAEFMELLRGQLLERHKSEPVHSTGEMETLAAKFPDNIELWTARSAEGTLLSGLIVYRDRPCSRVQYSATSSAGRACAATDAIYLQLLRDLPDGASLDLGTSVDPATGELDEKLLFYKESLGGRIVIQETYQLTLDSAQL